MRRICLSTLLSVALLGCISVTPSAVEVRSKTAPAAIDCADIPLAEALHRMERGLKRCHERSQPATPITAGTNVVAYTPTRTRLIVERQPIENGTSLVVRHIDADRNVWMVVDLQETKECKAHVVLRGSNFAWESIAKRSVRHLHEAMADCPLS